MPTLIVATVRPAIWESARLFVPALEVVPAGKPAFAVGRAGFAWHGPRRLPGAGVAGQRRASKAASAARSTSGRSSSTLDVGPDYAAQTRSDRGPARSFRLSNRRTVRRPKTCAE